MLERVDVLQLGLGAQLLGAAQSQRYVGVATKRSFFHVAVADPQGAHQGAQRAHVLGRFIGRTNVGLAHDLDQGHARAIEVHEADARIVVNVLARIVFQVDAGQAYAPGFARHAEFHHAAFAQGFFILRDLKPLGQVRVEVVFARESAARPDVRTHRHAQTHRRVDHGSIEHRQRARQAQANRIGAGIGLLTERGRRPGKDLGTAGQVHMHLQSNDGFISIEAHDGSLGNRLCQSVRRWYSPPTRKTASSPSGGPMICNPIGRLPLVKPQHWDRAGTPASAGATV